MSKLTKIQAKAHAEAVEILKKDALSYDERVFVLNNWQESATHINGVAGAFFTPCGLARDFGIEVSGRRVVDLCAGIGSLAFAYWDHSERKAEITCIEINRDYCDVGRKVLPEATWICADVFEHQWSGPEFDCAISNPPFGNVRTHQNKYGAFEYDLIALAHDIARDGVFLLPQMSVPWRYSKHSHFEKTQNEKYFRFSRKTGIELTMNCGIDCDVYREDWKALSVPVLEIALGFESEDAETDDDRARQAQGMFNYSEVVL